MLTLNFTPFPVLHTERLLLRQTEETDAEEIFFLRSDPQMLKYLDRLPAKSIDEAIAWIKMINDNVVKNDGITWAVTLKNEPKLIGSISLWNIQKNHYRSEIGYVLHTAHQGKGLMNEVMGAVLDYGFRQMNLHSIEANVNPNNAASIKLLERNNFVREAYYKENYYHDGKFLDSAVYSLITPLKQ